MSQVGQRAGLSNVAFEVDHLRRRRCWPPTAGLVGGISQDESTSGALRARTGEGIIVSLAPSAAADATVDVGSTWTPYESRRRHRSLR